MAFFFTLLLWVGTFALSQLLTPEPELENARPATLDDFTFPTATEGRMIPLHWGTDLMKGPNVIWYGDLRAIPKTEKIKVNLFEKKKIIVGWVYYIGFQMGICLGPATLKAIYIGDEKVWSGTQATDGAIEISHENAIGTFRFFTGSKTQATSTYLETHQTLCPAYRGLCYGVWEGGYVGESTSIKPWSFEIERCPTGLASAHPKVNDADSNPVEIAYEILTDTSWGYGYSPSDIDLPDFRAKAEILYAEGQGMSFILANQKKATSILQEIEKQIDGHLRIDAQSGLWKLDLIRDGYSIDGLQEANSSNIKEIVEFSRSGWEGTVNSVRVRYKRRANNYAEGFVPAHDSANMKIQNRRVPAIFSFIGLRDDTLANKIVWRELRARSYPFAKLRMRVNREFWNSYVGKVILFTYTFQDFSITKMPFRITRIDAGNTEEPEIMIDAVQDVFSWKSGAFSDPDASSWTIPETNLEPFAGDEQLVLEAPYAMSRRHDTPTEGRLFCGGVSPGREEAGFEIMQRNSSGTPSGSFYSAGSIGSFLWVGTLNSDVDNDETTLNVTTDLNAAEIIAATDYDIGNNLVNLVMIGDEFLACSGASTITGGLSLTGCYRGLLDSAQASHLAGTDVYIFIGGGLSDVAFDPTYNIHVRLLPFNTAGNQVAIDDSGITQVDIAMNKRERRPYPPTFLRFNAVTYPASVNIDSDVAVTFNRRDFRIFDEVSQNATDASTINGDFPANNSTQYQLILLEGITEKWTGSWNAGTASLSITRTKILRYLDGLPSDLTLAVHTRHTKDTVVYEALYRPQWTASVISGLSGDVWLGVIDTEQIGAKWTAPSTGTYAFSLESALAGDVEARINGGTFQTIITAGNLVGDLTGVAVNDIIEVRHQDSSSSNEVLLTIDSPSHSEDAFAVLIFDNVYGPTYGGFGIGGFGTGPFGR